MFKKVLVAEDLDSISIGITTALQELDLQDVQHVKYCDDAFLRIKKALLEQQPFDLLITDLSFLADQRGKAVLSSGEDLIAAVRTLQADIKIIAFTIEDKPFRIRSLFDRYGLSGFVAKGRNSIPELQKAILAVSQSDQPYLSPGYAHILRGEQVSEVDAIDLQILKMLSQGNTVDQIANRFKLDGQVPSSTSSIEKRINKMKIFFSASNSTHLVSLSKDLGMI